MHTHTRRGTTSGASLTALPKKARTRTSGGIAGAAAGLAEIVFFAFLVFAAIALIASFFGRGSGPSSLL